MGAAAQQMSDDGWAPWQGALSDPNQGGDVSWRQDPGRMLGRGGGGNQWARSFWATLSWRSRKRRRQMPEPFGSRPDISRQGSGVWRRKGQNGRSSPPSQPHSHHGPGAQANDLVSFSWQPQEAGLLPLLQKARQLGLREVRDQLESHTAER